MSPPVIEQFNSKLVGWPDTVLTAVLIMISIAVALVAVRGKPYAKAVIATWLLVP
jgi:hypothetical protein